MITLLLVIVATEVEKRGQRQKRGKSGQISNQRFSLNFFFQAKLRVSRQSLVLGR
jgi:hypothetical protein